MRMRILYLFLSFLIVQNVSAFQDPSVLSNQKLFSYIDSISEVLGYEKLQHIEFNILMSLVRQLGQLDRYNLSPDELLAHLQSALDVRGRYDFDGELTDEEFEAYLLPLRMRYESTVRSTWRPFFKEMFIPLTEGRSIENAAEVVFTSINERIKFDPSTTYVLPYRGDLDPLTTWKGKWGDEIDVSILACAILRSIGIPSRLVYTPQIRASNGGKVWLEFMNEQKAWIPWVPTFSTKLATTDHVSALKIFLKDKCGVIFASPAKPIEVTEEYLPTQTVIFEPTKDPKNVLEYNLAFEVGDLLKPIRGYELVSISSTNPERHHATSIYWSFIVQDDLQVLGIKHQETHQK